MTQEREAVARLQRFCHAEVLAEVYGEHISPLGALRADIRVLLALRSGGEGWQDISTAPLGKLVLAWNPCWRQPWPARPNGDNGAVWVDTCEPEAAGWQAHATHWKPLDAPSPSTHGEG